MWLDFLIQIESNDISIIIFLFLKAAFFVIIYWDKTLLLLMLHAIFVHFVATACYVWKNFYGYMNIYAITSPTIIFESLTI